MSLKGKFDWGTVADLLEKRKADHAAELEAWWNEIAPAGERFNLDKAIALLLHNVKRFEAALLRIAEKADEQKALMDHQFTTGQEGTAVDMARYLSYLKTAHIAAEALGRPDLIFKALKNLDTEDR